MHDPFHELKWEVRLACYDSLLRSVIELLETTGKIMKVDGLSEAVEDLEDLRKALLAAEDAWVTVPQEWTSALPTRDNQMETEGDAE